MASGDEIYSNLNSKKLSDVSAGDIEIVTSPLHIQKSNEDALRTTVLINEASMRDGGIIPDSGEVKTYTQTNDSDYQFIIPPDGEVWMIQGISSTVDASGANTSYLYLTSPGLTATADMVYLSSIASSSDNVPIFPSDAEYKSNFLEVTSNMYIRVHSNMDNVTTGSTTFKVGYVRKR